MKAFVSSKLGGVPLAMQQPTSTRPSARPGARIASSNAAPRSPQGNKISSLSRSRPGGLLDAKFAGAYINCTRPASGVATRIRAQQEIGTAGVPVPEPVPEPVVAPPPVLAPKPNVKVRFQVKKQVEFGEHVCVVGAGPTLGNWNPDKAVPMDNDLVKYDEWHVEIEVPSWEMLEYKYIVRSGWSAGAGSRWQAGPNSILATNRHKHVVVDDIFADEGSHECPSTHPGAAAAERAATAAMAAYHTEGPALMQPAPPVSEGSEEESSLLPEWARGATMYQIYPLGFCGAPMYNDGTGPVIPRLEKLRDYYGYMQELGVDAIYFSPLFESETHGYDTTDYFKIDRRLGDVALFKEIVKELHDLGIRVVLDGVFNHTGRTHFAFQDIKDKGPALSEYSSWYHVGARSKDHPGWCSLVPNEDGVGFSYDCWEGHDLLPRLELDEPGVREHIFEVARYWLEEIGCDGWRLDVAHEIPPAFWAEFRKVCKAAKPDCILVGEMIHGNYNNWVGADLLDSGTNYQQSKAIWSSLKDRNYYELVHTMLREDQLYGDLELLNFLGNHDVSRIASVLDDPRHYKLATAFMLTVKGMPCIYYGDELAMKGTPDGPDGDDAMRRPMPSPDNSAGDWPEHAAEWLAQTKQLTAIRKANPALSRGTFEAQHMVNTNEQFGFIRKHPLQGAAVLLNCSGFPAQMQMPAPCLEEGMILEDQLQPGFKVSPQPYETRGPGLQRP